MKPVKHARTAITLINARNLFDWEGEQSGDEVVSVEVRIATQSRKKRKGKLEAFVSRAMEILLKAVIDNSSSIPESRPDSRLQIVYSILNFDEW